MFDNAPPIAKHLQNTTSSCRSMGQHIAEIEKKLNIPPMPQAIDPLVALEESGKMEDILKMSGEVSQYTHLAKKLPIPIFQISSSDPHAFHRAFKTLQRYKLEKVHPDNAHFFKELKEEIEINLLNEHDCLHLLRLLSNCWVRQLIENLSELPMQGLLTALHNAVVPTKSLEQKRIELESRTIRKTHFMEDSLQIFGEEISANPHMSHVVLEELTLRRAMESVPPNLKLEVHKKLSKAPWFEFHGKTLIDC